MPEKKETKQVKSGDFGKVNPKVQKAVDKYTPLGRLNKILGKAQTKKSQGK